VATAIEFTHRGMSGLALVLALVLVAWAWRALPRGHPSRKAAVLSLAFLVLEALLGAGLVLFGWVATDASAGRGWAMALHLTNTFLLLAALTLTAARCEPPAGQPRRPLGALPALLAAGVALTMLAGITGAVAALGDTLFPATSFAEGLRQELDGGARLLLRLRVLHPFAAMAAGAALVACAYLAVQARPEPAVRAVARSVVVLVGAAVAAGVLNLVLLAPVWLQITHLALADLAWISLVLLGARSLAPAEQGVPVRRAAAAA
jgi:cytochrome c oxidase assembly protein subunit 15